MEPTTEPPIPQTKSKDNKKTTIDTRPVKLLSVDAITERILNGCIKPGSGWFSSDNYKHAAQSIAEAFLFQILDSGVKTDQSVVDEKLGKLTTSILQIKNTVPPGYVEECATDLLGNKRMATAFVRDTEKITNAILAITNAAGGNRGDFFAVMLDPKLVDLFLDNTDLFVKIAKIAGTASGGVIGRLGNDKIANLFISKSKEQISDTEIRKYTMLLVTFEKYASRWVCCEKVISDRRFNISWLADDQKSEFGKTMEELESSAKKIEASFGASIKGCEGDRGGGFLTDRFFEEMEKRGYPPDWKYLRTTIRSSALEKIGQIREFMKKNTSDLEKLSQTSQYKGKKTEVLYQGEGTILASGGGIDGIYSFGAENCSIVAAVVKNTRGEVVKIGAMHVDPGMKDKALEEFFGKLKGDGNNIEMYIISGAALNAVRVFEISKRYGNIIFMDCDINGRRDDAAVIDKQGTVYYGHIEALDDHKKAGAIDAARSAEHEQGGGIKIKDLAS